MQKIPGETATALQSSLEETSGSSCLSQDYSLEETIISDPPQETSLKENTSDAPSLVCERTLLRTHIMAICIYLQETSLTAHTEKNPASSFQVAKNC